VEQTLLRLATLYRQSGNSLLGGCGLLAVGDLIRVVAGPDPGNALLAIGWFLQAVGALLALLGIPGLYSRIVAGTGLLGVAGLTGIMLAFARIAGETAPLMFTALGNQFWSFSANQPIAALPLQIYTYALSPYEDWIRQAWAGALVLVVLIVSTIAVVRFLFGRSVLREVS